MSTGETRRRRGPLGWWARLREALEQSAAEYAEHPWDDDDIWKQR